MEYSLQIEYLRRVPWWRRIQLRLLKLSSHRYWYSWSVPFTNWLKLLGFNRWFIITYDPFEYAEFELKFELAWMGQWNLPEPEVGYMSAWYELDSWSVDSIVLILPGDYEPQLQEDSLQKIIDRHDDQIREAILEYIYP